MLGLAFWIATASTSLLHHQTLTIAYILLYQIVLYTLLIVQNDKMCLYILLRNSHSCFWMPFASSWPLLWAFRGVVISRPLASPCRSILDVAGSRPFLSLLSSRESANSTSSSSPPCSVDSSSLTLPSLFPCSPGACVRTHLPCLAVSPLSTGVWRRCPLL